MDGKEKKRNEEEIRREAEKFDQGKFQGEVMVHLEHGKSERAEIKKDLTDFKKEHKQDISAIYQHCVD